MKCTSKLVFVLLIVSFQAGWSATRIKDIAYVKGVRGQQLIGYGLVVGLNGTGDTQRSTFTIQSVTSMLKRFGITVPSSDVRTRNAAAVMVTATVPAFSKEGGAIDVMVSSLGDATGLQGGTLLMTPLSGLDGAVYATAQGALSVGGMSVRAGGSEVRRNHTAAGRIPSGAVLEKSVTTDYAKGWKVAIVLLQSDFTTASRIAEGINAKLGKKIAWATDASTVAVEVPDSSRTDGKLVEFISIIEILEINPDVAARVVINERTGTIVVGGNVSILPVAISHGGVNIEIQQTPVISQPNAFSSGKTVSTSMTTVAAGIDSSSVVALEGAATVQDIAKSLNALKVSPRDIIAIFQALKEAGALKADLVII
ncbi:MAG: flagellar basal body P-ring protein FlgI [Ignavibacteriales bacterium]|nr:flagellar basal body P-ring protein FlgI [Ignavibacteriales bacterium]